MTVRLIVSPLAGVSATYSATGHRFDRHWHDAYSFGLLDDGGQSWRSRRGTVNAYAGAVINTLPGEVHDGRPLGRPMRRWRILTVEPDVLHRITGHDVRAIEIGSPVIEDVTLARALRRLFVRLERWSRGSGDDVAQLGLEEALAESCSLFVSRHGTAPAATPNDHVRIDAVRDRLAHEPARTHSLAELAGMVGASRYQVLRQFRARFGLPPHAWLLSRRAELARQLIRSGLSLSMAAMRSGFADQSHMTRVFARFYGHTPGQWHRAIHAVAMPLKKV